MIHLTMQSLERMIGLGIRAVLIVIMAMNGHVLIVEKVLTLTLLIAEVVTRKVKMGR